MKRYLWMTRHARYLLFLPALTLVGSLGLPAPWLLVPTPVEAQESPTDLVVLPAWLAQHLNDPDLVLLQVGPEEEYGAEHIPGALWVPTDSLAAPEDHEAGTGLSLQMPDPAHLAGFLSSLGIRSDSRIIVYYGTDWVTPSTRVILTLDWIGLGDRVSLLDGGMRLWKAQGNPVTSRTPLRLPSLAW